MVNHYCCAPDCTISSQKIRQKWKYPGLADVIFFTFPTEKSDPKRRKLWIDLVRRENFDVKDITKHTRICSRHWSGVGPTKNEPDPTIFAHNLHIKAEPNRKSSASHIGKRTFSVMCESENDNIDNTGADNSRSDSSTNTTGTLTLSIDFVSTDIGVQEEEIENGMYV